MKTIGLIGGLTWESTKEYYRLVNQEIGRRLGGHHSAKIIIHSVDFQDVLDCMLARDWAGAAERMVAAAKSLERAGADFVMIGTNTLHKVAPEVEAAVNVPLLNLIDVVGRAIRAAGLGSAALLGTRFVMSDGFYRYALNDRHGLKAFVPEPLDIETVNAIIFDELAFGKTEPASAAACREIIQRQVDLGAEAVILGCTELPLLLGPEDAPVPVFDTTELHALAAVEEALAD